MLDARSFSGNKWIRYFAFFIVFGMGALMLLPTVSLNEMFTGSSSKFLTINGEDIYTKGVPLEGPGKPEYTASIHTLLSSFASGNNKNQMFGDILYVIRNWNKPHPNFLIESRMRKPILRAITYHLNLKLADELNMSIEEDDLNDFIKQSFKQLLIHRYNEEKKKDKSFNMSQADYIEENRLVQWDSYSDWAKKYMEGVYIDAIFTSSLNNGIVPTFADMDNQYRIQEHKVQVDYGLYTFDQFVRDSRFLNNLDENELKKYYTDTEEKITAEQVTFNSIEKANDAKRDPNLFNPVGDNKNEFESQYITLKSDHPHFLELSQYSKGSVTDVITRQGEDKKYYIFKIVSKSPGFKDLKADREEYIKFIKVYTDKHYDKFKDTYEKRGQEVMESFLKTAQSGKIFLNLQSLSPDIKNVRVGRTDYFSQDAFEVNEFQEKPKDGKKEENPKSINEFLLNEFSMVKQEKYYNEEFFKTAFSLKKGELSPKVHSSIVKEGDKKVFFVVRNVDIKEADLSKPVPFDQKHRMFLSSKFRDVNLVDNGWAQYVMDKYGYEVEVDVVSIMTALGYKIPKTPVKTEEKK